MNRLKTILTAAISTGLICTTSAAMAGHTVSKTAYKPNPRTTIVNKTVCGHRGCVNIHKKIRNRPNGTQKIVTQSCRHGFCNKQVIIRG